MEEEKKPQLHQSHLTTLYRCGEKFYRKYILGHKEPNTLPLVVGSTNHNVAADNLNHKIKHEGSLKAEAEIKDLAHDYFIKNWEEHPIIFNREEKAMGIQKVKGIGIDQSIQLSALHHHTIAPVIWPADGGVEQKWVIECNGYPYDLAGSWDVREVHRSIRDLKNLKRNPGQNGADSSEQFTIYAMAYYIVYGEILDEIWMDCIIKKKVPDIAMYKTNRTVEDFVVAKARFERSCKIIEAGAFAPASRADWWCSEEYCGFAADGSCPFFNKNRSMTINIDHGLKQSEKGEQKNGTEKLNRRSSERGNSRRIIDAGSEEWRRAAGDC